MPFEPKCKDHSLIEVVFGLVFSRRFKAGEIDAVIAAHDQWQADLPRLGRTPVFQIAFGDEPPLEAPQMAGGVAFDRVKPNGNLEWRLRVEDVGLLVNCLAYENWDVTWPKARDFLRLAHAALASPDNSLSGILLQYINVFEWSGAKADYKIEHLLKKDSEFVPNTIWDKGALWHLHQGWYKEDGLPVEGRLLERTHMDAVLDNKQLPTVKIDNYLNLQLTPCIDGAAIFNANPPIVDKIFLFLRNANKILMRSIVTKDMAERIGLNA